MNILTATGNLGRDSEVRDAGGTKVCNFSLACTVGYGERKHTLWIDCAIWGKRGETLHQWLVKGKKVVVSGEADVRSYEKKDGEPGANIVMNVNDVEFLGSNEEGSAPPKASAPQGEEIPF